MKYFWYSFLGLFSLGFLGLIAAIAIAVGAISYYGKDLPDYAQLKTYEHPITTRIYAGDGRLLAEYATEKRVFVPVEVIPDIVKQAFIAAEDKNFYKHGGLDYVAIIRAGFRYIINIGSGRRPQGASTITQQVAKNFLLTNEVSFTRKIKEAILATRMEQAMSKDRLLELYLNEIFFGIRSYGIASAALNYFNKSVEELSIAEAAYLAALPKAPNNYHPVRNHEAAVARRNWVLSRMEEDGYITRAQRDLAELEPLRMIPRPETKTVSASYFAEEIRRKLEARYQEEALYGGGMAVRSSVDPSLQEAATNALRNGLMDYDKRWGYRGPVATFENLEDWRARISRIQRQENMLPGWELAVVLEAGSKQAEIGFGNHPKGVMKLEDVKWARESLQDGYARGPEITRVSQVLKPGHVIMVAPVEPKEGQESAADAPKRYQLMQVPRVQGAIIALDPHTGRVLAMQGGWMQGSAHYNRATQAHRQPGSAFKPFVYLSALDRGFTPATMVLDAPFVYEHKPGQFWKPTNYSGEYYGPTPIRVGVEKSRNLMTVRLAEFIGMETISDYAGRFGIAEDMPHFLSFSLGAAETTLLDLTASYGMLVNGGKKIEPTFIDRIQDRRGKTIFKHDERDCLNCGDLIRWQSQDAPEVPDGREQIADPRTAYQMVSIMEGVIQRGTSTRAKKLGRPLAGKTGTTNESKDTWFIGFSPDLAVGVFVGYDEPRSLGRRETGASVALPVWIDFMGEALKDVPPSPFRIPPGIRQVLVNAETGARARPGDQKTLWESFVVGTEPTDDIFILDDGGISATQELNNQQLVNDAVQAERNIFSSNSNAVTTGTGGVY